MTQEIIYLAGPMSGMPEFNWPVFKRAAKELREAGEEVRCPTESGATHETSYHECLKADLGLLLECNAIALLPGWRVSKGATLEAFLAFVLGYNIYLLEPINTQGTLQLKQQKFGIIKLFDYLFSSWANKTMTVVVDK